MNDNEAEAWREKEIAATNYRSKLRDARERKGLTILEAAQLINSIGDYYDIEEHDRDFTGCYSLNEITKVCETLGIHPRNLFCDKTADVIPLSQVIERIKAQCIEKKISISEFESIAGWQIENCISNPAIALVDWNIDCLVDICRYLNIDWRCVIAGL